MEYQLCAKFYAKPFACIHPLRRPTLEVTIFTLEVIQIWQHLRLLKEKSPESRPCSLHFLLLCFSLAMPSFARKGSTDACRHTISVSVCTGETGLNAGLSSWVRKLWFSKVWYPKERGSQAKKSILEMLPQRTAQMSYWTSSISPFIYSANTF